MKKYLIAAAVAFLPTLAQADFCDRYDCNGSADRWIRDDARSWFMNRYDRGSARVVDVWESPSGIDVELTVDYTYNGGRRGWVEIQVFDGRIRCLRYHDFQDTCRPPR